MADYSLEPWVEEMNGEAARLAREAADSAEDADRPATGWVAGALGPTNRTASLSPDVNDPGARSVSFEQLADAYLEAARALVAGGADLLLIETIYDTLNAKAAIFAVETLWDELGSRLPLVISGTITDLSGRTLSGQTVAAFWDSVRHARPLAVGPQLRAGRGPAAAVRAGAREPSPTRSSRCTRTRACRTRSAATTRRRPIPRRSSASSPRTASSTSSAAAAARRPRTSRSSPRRCGRCRRGSCRSSSAARAWRASSRSRSDPTRCSSTSASART